jgi:hypothetical protein
VLQLLDGPHVAVGPLAVEGVAGAAGAGAVVLGQDVVAGPLAGGDVEDLRGGEGCEACGPQLAVNAATGASMEQGAWVSECRMLGSSSAMESRTWTWPNPTNPLLQNLQKEAQHGLNTWKLIIEAKTMTQMFRHETKRHNIPSAARNASSNQKVLGSTN